MQLFENFSDGRKGRHKQRRSHSSCFDLNLTKCFGCSTRRTNMYRHIHYDDVTMGAMAFQITSLTIVYSTVFSDTDQRKHQSSVSLAFVWGIHQWPMNSPHKWPVTRKSFDFMTSSCMFIVWGLNKYQLLRCTNNIFYKPQATMMLGSLDMYLTNLSAFISGDNFKNVLKFKFKMFTSK